MSATYQVGAPEVAVRSLEGAQSLDPITMRRMGDLSRFCRQIFRKIDLREKTMLEIGCGEGILCLWASLQGAQEVVGLEANDQDVLADDEVFTSSQRPLPAASNHLGLARATISSCTFQEYTAPDRKFDIVLSLASINRLDEESCIRLHNSRKAVRAYETILRRVARMMKPGGKLIIVDAGRRNFFEDLGMRNPMLPAVEWFKHQQPEDWAWLLQNCGFERPKITWTTGEWLRRLGILRLPRMLAYFGQSTFRLEMTRAQNSR